MKTLKKYLSVYRLMWKQVTDYRFEFLAELVCTFIPVIALYYLWSDIYIAEKSRSMVFCSVIYIVVFAFLFKGKMFYGSGVDIVLFFVEVMVAMVFYFQIAMVIGLLSFWIYEISSWYYTLTFAIEFLAGGLFPLTLLPESVSNICRYMPFQYMIYFPARTLLMGTDRTEVIRYFYVIVPWIVGLGILLEVLWKNGLKHYELIGG